MSKVTKSSLSTASLSTEDEMAALALGAVSKRSYSIIELVIMSLQLQFPPPFMVLFVVVKTQS